MRQRTPAKALAIYVGENDHIHGKPVYTAVVEAAREHGLAGATAGRAVMGFGAHSKIHTMNIVLLAEDLPIVICIVDVAEKIEGFWPILESLVTEGTVISWDVELEILRREPRA